MCVPTCMTRHGLCVRVHVCAGVRMFCDMVPYIPLVDISICGGGGVMLLYWAIREQFKVRLGKLGFTSDFPQTVFKEI